MSEAQLHAATINHLSLLLAEMERLGVEAGPVCRVCECTDEFPGEHDWVEEDLCAGCDARIVKLVPVEYA